MGPGLLSALQGPPALRGLGRPAPLSTRFCSALPISEAWQSGHGRAYPPLRRARPTATRLGWQALPAFGNHVKSRGLPGRSSAGPAPSPPGLGRGSRGRPRLSGFCLHLLGGAGPMTPLLCVSSSICDPP